MSSDEDELGPAIMYTDDGRPFQKFLRSGKTVWLKPVDEEIVGHRVGMRAFDAASLLDETLQTKAESLRDLLLNVPLGKINRGTALAVRRLMEEYRGRMADLVQSQVTTRKELDTAARS